MLIYNNNGTFWTYLGRREGKAERASTQVRSTADTKADLKAQRAEATEVARDLRARWRIERDRARPSVLPAPAFAPFARQWEREWGALQRGAEGRLRYVVATLIGAFGTYALTDITPALVHTWRVARLAQGVGPATVNRELDVLKSILSTGAPQYYAEAPVRRMPRLTVPPVHIPTLDVATEKKLAAAFSPLDTAIFLVALDSLVRLGDVLSLRWRDVDFDAHVVRLVHTKNGTAHTAPLSARAEAALRDILPAGVTGSDWVFGAAGGTHRQRANSTATRMRRLCARLGIETGRKQGGLTFHAMTRHTGASRMVEAGVDLRSVQEVGGWASMSMLSRYVHPSAAMLKAAVETIGGTE